MKRVALFTLLLALASFIGCKKEEELSTIEDVPKAAEGQELAHSENMLNEEDREEMANVDMEKAAEAFSRSPGNKGQ